MSKLPSYRCPTCELESPLGNPRNLVVSIDGTSNKPGDKNTNVVKFHTVIKENLQGPGLEQRKHYLEGIGADELNQLSWMDRKLEQAFAGNVAENIKNAYSWLAEHYREGDRIYLFGFSRGGFQVRALASMVHEVGLVMDKERTELAYNRYQAIDPYNPETRRQATQFKRVHCWQSVRIHFVGVWDTVSSLGFIKKDVHITASASVTNACHFRHALSLDECRVKFMPEYFLEMNAHRSSVRSPRLAVEDVKEVWFAGSHGDVGGTERQSNNQTRVYEKDEDAESYPVHAGNVPLLWMQREAADKGLVFKQREFAWDPEDVDFGRRDSLLPGSFWRVFEYLPVRHQVSFSGTGEHKYRWHLSRPRSIIPGQQIHDSILSGYMYTPRAILRNNVCIPAMNQNSPEGLWTAGLPDEEAVTRLLSLLLSDQRKTLECLGKVLFLLDSKLGSGQIQSVSQPQWSEKDILGLSDFPKFALTVVSDATPKCTVSQALLTSAKEFLCDVLPKPYHPNFHETLGALRFLTRHQELRRHFCSDEVIDALVPALEWTEKSQRHAETSFPLVTDSLCNLIRDDNLRGKVVVATSGKLSVALEIKSPNLLVALLKMIATLSLLDPGSCRELQPKITELAKRGGSPVGQAAIKALVALRAPLTRDIHTSNVLDYLCNTLPQSDADGGSATSAEDINDLPSILLYNGSGPLDEEVVGKLVSTIKSCDLRDRTAATLTIVKLCGNVTFRNSCKQNKVLDIFMLQLKKKRTSLLAAYALNTCLKYKDMWSSSDYPRAAQLIVAMMDKGWFDDAVGQVEGCKILRRLMDSDDLRQHINVSSVCTTLVGKLEAGKRHEVRTSLSYLEILGKTRPLEFGEIVADNVKRLKERGRKVQTKGVKVLAHLALTAAGERAIQPHLIKIVKMMPPFRDPPVPRDQLFGPTAALYDLSKNETLREQIQKLPEFASVRNYFKTGLLPAPK